MLSDDSRRVMDAARAAYGPSMTDRARVRRLLAERMVSVAAAATSGQATAVRSTALATKATLLAVITGVIVTAAVVVGVWSQHQGPRATREFGNASPLLNHLNAPFTERLKRGSTHAPTALSTRSGVAMADEVRKGSRADAHVVNTQVALGEEPGPNVAGEIALLGEAQKALALEQPARALEILKQHARIFPRGALAEERNAARIVALCKQGRSKSARAEADEFIKKAPQSPLSQRVRSTCGYLKQASGSAK